MINASTKLTSEKYLPKTLFTTRCNELRGGRQLVIFLHRLDYGPCIEVYQPVSSLLAIESCHINIYEAQGLGFDDAVLFHQAFTHAVMVASIWNIDTGRHEVWP